MKCKNPNCQREAARGQIYCSRAHAPYSYLAGENNTQSNKKEEDTISSSVEPGAPSVRSKKGDKGTFSDTYVQSMIDKLSSAESKQGAPTIKEIKNDSQDTTETATEDSLPLKERSSPIEMQNEKSETQNTDVESSASGTPETGKNIVPMNGSGAEAGMKHTASSQRLDFVSEVKSVSMSLIDSSVSELHDLLKNVGIESNERNRRADPTVVNAACNCGKQIAGLLRLKIDLLRVMK